MTRRVLVQHAGSSTSGDRKVPPAKGDWYISKRDASVTKTVRDATGRIVDRYSETLRKLADE
jgi:hypothetical protein